MSERHPTSDRASGGLPAALSEARAALGTPAQVERLRSKLAASVGAPGADSRGEVSQAQGSEHGAQGASAASQPLTAAMLKVVSWVAGLAALGVVAWVSTRTPSGDSETLRGDVATNSAQGARVAPSSATASGIPASAPATAASTPAVSSAAPSPAAPLVAAPDPASPTAATTAHPRASASKPKPRGDAKLAGTERGASLPAGASKAAAPETEVQLVTRAQGLLDAQPRAALEVLREHERLYPRGMLREERDVLRIDAEWSLGERTQALTHAREFVQRYPHSAQARRFNALLEDHKNPSAGTRTE